MRVGATHAAGDDHAIARLERLCRNADVDELVSVVHLELVALVGAGAVGIRGYDDVRMRIHELEFRDASFEGSLARVVVHAANRVMGGSRCREHGGCQRDHRSQGWPGPLRPAAREVVCHAFHATDCTRTMVAKPWRHV